MNGILEGLKVLEMGHFVAAPEPGQHTEEILLEMGYNWDEISQLKDDGAII